MLFGESIQLEQLTEDKARELCESVFPELAKTTLEITLGNRNTIPLWKQFYFRFENKFLKYSTEKTTYLMANIYQHSEQDILKLKLFKEKQQELNNPEAFSLTRVNSTLNNNTSGNMNNETMTGGRGDKGLLIANNDSLTSESTKGLERGASSALHEDYKEIDKSWDKRDIFLAPEQGIKMPEVKLPEEDGAVDLDSIKIGSIDSTDIRQKQEPAPQLSQEQDEFSEIIYTDVTLGKSMNKTNSSSFTAGKTLNNSKVDVSVNKSILTTSMSGSNTKSLSLEFTKNDTTYQALSLYASNFRESFFNSFNCLFVNFWTGY